MNNSNHPKTLGERGEPEQFEGYAERECGEHRTTGHRAWCFVDTEWCYESIPCRGCELPQLRARVTELERLLKDADLGIPTPEPTDEEATA